MPDHVHAPRRASAGLTAKSERKQRAWRRWGRSWGTRLLARHVLRVCQGLFEPDPCELFGGSLPTSAVPIETGSLLFPRRACLVCQLASV